MDSFWLWQGGITYGIAGGYLQQPFLVQLSLAAMDGPGERLEGPLVALYTLAS